MDASLGVDGNLARVCKYNAGGADGRERTAVSDDARADCRRRVVSGAADNRCAGRKSGRFRGLRRDRTGDLRAFIDRCEQGLVDAELLEHLVAPAAVGDIQQTHAGRVRNLGGELAGQAVADEILREKDVTALFIDLRLVVAHPKNLGGGPAGERRIGGQLNQTVLADLLVDLVALLAGALVAPDDAAAQNLALAIQHDQTVHLSGQTDAADLGRIRACL